MFRLLTTGVLVLLATRAEASSLSYLYLEGIRGEAVSARHSGWIEVESFSFGASSVTNAPVNFLPLQVTKLLDKATPQLFLHVANGRQIRNGVLDVVRTDSAGVRLLQLHLSDVIVSGVQQSGPAGEIPMEVVSLNYAAAKWTYTEISADGRPLRDIVCSWNSADNTGSGGTIALDSDNDGMPDDYELLYGLRIDASDADEDLDGDGMTNLEEFRAGTIPNEANSTFRVSGARTAAGGASLSWEGAPGKTYRLMAATSPSGPFEFIRFLTEEEASAGNLQLPTTGSFQFFILELE